MNRSPNRNDTTMHIATGVKAAILVFALALIAMLADSWLDAPAKAPVIGATSSVIAHAPPTALALRAHSPRPAAPTSRPYPEPGDDVERDANGHPASF